MRRAASVPVHPRLAGRALRAGLAAALVVGVSAALPSLADEGAVYTDDTGSLAAPAPLLAPGNLAFIGTCPELPPDQGVDIWVYALPEDVAVEGAAVTVTGTAVDGPAAVTAAVFTDECGFDRYEYGDTITSPTEFLLGPTDRFLAVSSDLGAVTELLLTVQPPSGTAEPTPSPDPTDPTPPSDDEVMARGDYSGVVNDPFYPEASTGPVGAIDFGGQWGMRIIQAAQAWQEQQATGAGIRVAVLDSGMDVTHEDFQCPGKIARLDAAKYPRLSDVTDTDGHGTHVAGIVGACTDNGTGVVGTAPDATILPIQALSPDDATAGRLAEAIRAATDSGAHVINMSLGFSAAGAPGTGSAVALVGGFANDIDPAIEYAVSQGVVVVAAAGNESFPVCGYPALAQDVVCVGSTDRRDLNAWYGNFPITPSGVALMAPGGSGQLFCDVQSENVLSTYSTQVPRESAPEENEHCEYPELGYRGLDGTSMASPHVAGVAALVYDRLGGQRSAAAAAAVKQALVDGAVDLYTEGYDPMSGEGRVDALGAVRAVTAVTPSPTPTGTAGTEEATELELVAPATVQTTDELPLAAQVSDGTGEPVAGAAVEFVLNGAGGQRSVSGTSDEDGVATATLPVDLAPGEYTLTAAYGGEPGVRQPASDDQPVQVTQDDSRTSLAVEGNAGSRALTGSVADDDSAAGLAGASVVLFADGREIGTVTTDDSGRFSFAPQGRDRSASTYEARFAGNDSYRGSAARADASRASG